MAEPLLAVERVSHRFGGLLAVNDVSLTAREGQIVALIGPNGAGKTTLFAIIARRGIARTFQITQPFAGLTVHENILVGAHLRRPEREAALAAAERVGRELGLGAMLDRPADTLNVAGRKRLELAKALATEPKLLLLDEVLAGLNPSEIRDIVPVIRALCQRGITIVMIEHVMQAVMCLAEHVFVLAEGHIIAKGTPSQVASDPHVVEAYLGHGAAAKLGDVHAN
jgi:branched-chain amino acid transport system ATP-binding protein